MSIYRVLRARNPAWYSAWMRFEEQGRTCAVVSSSPELFLRVLEGEVITRPIKGTRPRIGDSKQDRAAAGELVGSEKDNAELAMIIDLLRNDLGRVCSFGTVCVTDPRRLETHPTVFHLVGTVSGRLREGVGIADLLRATFPGGSITGAPKIRAMEIIDELEPVARGVYTGCIGIIGADGSARLNIAIRTIVCEDDRALVQVGGGIVADSDPDAEYRETLDKARAMLESIEMAAAE
jgi:para-aminobenzoate synthetase component 1